jgi:hypothetical protein
MLNGHDNAEEVGGDDGKSGSPSASLDRFASGHDILLVNGTVDERLFSGIIRELSSQADSENQSLLLVLVTYGGVANDAYRIGRALQYRYNDISVFVPSFCKSAGTLIACSANVLLMAPFAELGPLDVQLLKRDELFERRSGLITGYALDELKEHTFELFEHFMLGIKSRGGSISFKMASEIAAKITSDIMDNVYSHINVESIGEDARNLRVASEYCTRLDKKFGNLQSDGINKLVHGYVSHDFVIDFEEAGSLFRRVEQPTRSVVELFQKNAREMTVPRTNDCLVKLLTFSHMMEPQGDGDGTQDGIGNESAQHNAPRPGADVQEA